MQNLNTNQFIKTSNLNNIRKNELYKMYQQTYKRIGANMNQNIMFNYYTNAVVFKNKNKKDKAAILFWPSNKGKKIGLVFGSNSDFMKSTTVPALARLLKSENTHWYAELSGALEHVLQKYHQVQAITNKDLIRRIVGLTNLHNIENNGMYERNIMGIGKHKKRLYGNPKNVNKP